MNAELLWEIYGAVVIGAHGLRRGWDFYSMLYWQRKVKLLPVLQKIDEISSTSVRPYGFATTNSEFDVAHIRAMEKEGMSHGTPAMAALHCYCRFCRPPHQATAFCSCGTCIIKKAIR